MVRSFDVFDTVITRSYGSPEDVLWHLGEILTKAGRIESASSFFQARQEAEGLAWQEHQYRKGIRLDRIYSILAAKLGWDKETAGHAMQEEIRLESEAARPVPDMQALLRASRARGERICFISDMYLSGADIQAILLRLGLAQAGEQVFVSSDLGETKRSGRLFDLIFRTLSIKPSDLFHIGDHLLGDFKVPRRKGINARLYPRAQLNRYEESILKKTPPGDWRLRSVASVSKFCRLSREQDEPGSRLSDLLCSTIAPFVAGYAGWLLAQASAKGIQKLFFMARDMQIVQEVAAQMAQARGLEIECIYIHASRVAWQAPAYTGPEYFELSWLHDHLPDKKMESVLRRLLSESDLEKLKRDSGDLLCGEAEPWDRAAQLLKTEPIEGLVREETTRRRKILLSYLEGKGYRPDGACALVDTGWRGTLQRCLARAYTIEAASPRVTAFYIGTRHRTTLEKGCELHSFLPDELVEKYGYSLAALLETLLTANHGTTLGYESAGGHEPILAAPPAPAFLQQWELVRECCTSYAAQLPGCAAFEGDLETLSRTLAHPFLTLCTHPAVDDARLLSAWIFDAGRDLPKPKEIAAPLDLKELLKLFVYKMRKTSLGNTYLASPWLHGSIQASSPATRWLAERLVAKS